MARNRINWDLKEDVIFRKMAAGEGVRDIADAVGVNLNALESWKKRAETKVRYGKFISENGLQDKSRYFVNRVNVQADETQSNKPLYQNKRDVFKNRVRVGQMMKNHRTGESGVVIAVYPNIFTMLLTTGFKASFTYNAFMEFEKGDHN